MRRLFFTVFIFYLVITIAGIIFIGSRLFLIEKDFNLLAEAQRSLIKRSELRDVIYELKHSALSEIFSKHAVNELKTKAQAIVNKCSECHHEERVRNYINELEKKISSLTEDNVMKESSFRKQKILFTVEGIIPSVDIAYSKAKSLVDKRLANVKSGIFDIKLTAIFSGLTGLFLFVGFSVNSFGRISRLEAGIKERERVLSDWAKQWQKTFDSIQDMVFIAGDDCRISMMNEAAKKRYGEGIGGMISNVLEDVFVSACQPICKQGVSKEISSGREVFVMRSFPVRQSSGGEGCVLVIRDVTFEKEMEMRVLQSEKLAALGKVIAGVAHELNNPLTAVNGYSELLLHENAGDRIRDMVEKINKAGMRMANVVKDLLVFTGIPNLRIEPVNVRQIMDNIVELVSESLESGKINLAADIENCIVSMDKFQMERMLLNLITNSIQAIEESGKGDKITLRAYRERDRFFIEVSDNGPGIPVNIINRIYDPFFTTKGFKKGTGLGLSICHNIAMAHGGDIKVKSIEGQGATFLIELPNR
ncbi:MAG: ATP-binding protein [Thermodesulfovibrionales bacterium]|nr:ATP-binding protein [Thermodesulfovibrionales bacterium]